MTFPERRQRVQTRMRLRAAVDVGAHGLEVGLEPPGDTLWAWLT